ncbi:MAG: sugar phosphate isomerase/epimerase [Anaerolineaceae bacterium]|nr:sugar phosphate isomerase/epimerase [Anaerolineaceae bacterium]
MKNPLYRLGTTSYILPDDLIPNVRFLTGKVQDVELILFDIQGGPSNLPDAATVEELGRLAEEHNLTYTVHLPLDLRLDENGGSDHISLRQAQRVIECTRPLHPWAYVAHLDRSALPALFDLQNQAQWVKQAARALECTAGWIEDPVSLAVENLEGYPPEVNLPVLELVPASLCIDIGHLWRDGHAAPPYLDLYLERARVVHLHGVGERDHASLVHTPPDVLRRTLDCLAARRYTGVLTLEVFNQADLESSLAVLQAVQGEL